MTSRVECVVTCCERTCIHFSNKLKMGSTNQEKLDLQTLEQLRRESTETDERPVQGHYEKKEIKLHSVGEAHR